MNAVMGAKSATLVALINMPIVTTQTPSLGLSQLKAELAQYDIPSDIHYLNIDYAEQVGLDILIELETLPTAQLVGDWIFCEALWGEDLQRDQNYVAQVLKDESNEHPHHQNRCVSDTTLQGIWRCRAQVEIFIEHCLKKIDWSQYVIVGFTSMFQQHIASLALAKRLKQRYPQLIIVFGGANCAADMGRALIENFEFVDAVCLGMGEGIFSQFVTSILQQKTPCSSKDFIIRGHIASLPLASKKSEVMDDIPFPDFDDFFIQRTDKTTLDDEPLSMMVETSRGCWWGQKHHCTFCGLNNETLHYRFKSAERALAEFQHLTARYGHYTSTIAVVDNIIPMDYLRTFLPMLRDSQLKLDIFYETKANLKKEHLRLYRDAGLYVVQPGIESFSNRLLKLMRKGITGLQNVQFLKWCCEFGVKPVWNYLAGFPGEVAEDHYHQLKWFPLLSHFYPPEASWVRIDRFSPYHSEPEKHGIKSIKPFSAFRYIYSGLSTEDQARVAYYFVGNYEEADSLFDYSKQVSQAIDQWQSSYGLTSLFYFDDGTQLTIIDDRLCAIEDHYVLSDCQRWLYLQCDKIRSLESLLSDAALHFDQAPNEQIKESLAYFVAVGLMLEDEGKYLALAVSTEYEYFPPMQAWQKLQQALQQHPSA